MKRKILTLALCSFTFALGLGFNNIAFSDLKTQKIAYVEVTKLLSTSKALKSAESARTKSTNEMLKWYDTASADIKKQKTEAGQKALVKKYEAQLTQKKKTINDTYSKKVKQVDAQILNVIAQKAEALGYDVVLKSDIVLYGGDDITKEILPLVK